MFEKGIIDIEVGSYYRPFSDEYTLIDDIEAESEEGGQEEKQNDEQQEQQTGEE